MVRKTFLIVILLTISLLVVLPSSLALEAFHTGWHYPGDTFTINGKLYSVSQGSNGYQINFGREGEYFILNELDCKETADKVERFCFLESACPDDDDHIKYEAGNIIYGAKIALYNLIPEVSIDNVASSTVVRLGDKLEFTATIKNKGEEAISNGVFEIRIPDGFELLNKPSSASFKNRLLTKSFSLGPGVEDIFKYTLKVKDYVSENMFANVSYYYNNKLYTYSSKKTTINVPSPYIISRTLSKTKVGVNEESLYQFTFENNDGQEDIDLTVRLDGAENLRVIYPEQFKDGVLQKTFSPGEKETYNLKLSSLKTSVNDLKLVFDMILQGEDIKKVFQNTLTCDIPDAQLSILMKKEVNENSDYQVRVTIKNPSSLNGYHNVKGYIINQATNEKHFFESDLVGKNHQELLLDFMTTAPEVENAITQTYLLKGTYESISGEQFEFSKTASVKILDKKEAFVLTRTLNDTSLKAGDLVQVSVKIKNQLGEYASLVINDVLPDSVFVKAGLRSAEMSVDIGKEEPVYIYKLLIPETYPDNKLKILTKVYDKNSGDVYQFNNTYDVESAAKSLVEDNQTSGVETKNNTNQVIEVREKKTGFFQKIVDGISNFFENLFN